MKPEVNLLCAIFESAGLPYLLSSSLHNALVADLRQELAVRQKERRPSGSLGKDTDRADAPCTGAVVPITPSKPLCAFTTPPASSIRRGNAKPGPARQPSRCRAGENSNAFEICADAWWCRLYLCVYLF